MCGAPLTLLSMVMSHFVRADGAAKTAGLVLSAGGLLISYTISVFFFKERFSALQKIGILLGLISLVFLNLTLVKIWR